MHISESQIIFEGRYTFYQDETERCRENWRGKSFQRPQKKKPLISTEGCAGREMSISHELLIRFFILIVFSCGFDIKA